LAKPELQALLELLKELAMLGPISGIDEDPDQVVAIRLPSCRQKP